MATPRTEQQEAVRRRFVACSKLASTFLQSNALGFRKYAAGEQSTEENAFMKLNMPAVAIDGSGVITVAYNNVVTPKGPLPKAVFGQADFSTSGVVSVPFDGNVDAARASGADNVYLVVYSPDIDALVVSTPARRSASAVTCELPASWTSLAVHVWGFAVGNAAGAYRDTPSDSAYIGTGEVE